jgi:hypothetical protein
MNALLMPMSVSRGSAKISRATSVASFWCLDWVVTVKVEPPQSPWSSAPAVYCGIGATPHLPFVFFSEPVR